MNIPCPKRNPCPPGSPLEGWSSETVDQLQYIGRSTGFGPTFPPLGSNWQSSYCLTFCESPSSQAAAQWCADQAWLECEVSNWPGYQLVGNATQYVVFYCSDGLPFTYVVPQGTLFGINQDAANAAAYAYGLQKARDNSICIISTGTEACLGAYNYLLFYAESANPPILMAVSSGHVPPGMILEQPDDISIALSGM